MTSKEIIKEKIGIAIGHASMCWSETPKGVFDSSTAEIVMEALLADVILYGIGTRTEAILELEAERAKVKELENELAYYKNGTQIKTIVIDDAYITENISLNTKVARLLNALGKCEDAARTYGSTRALGKILKINKQALAELEQGE